MNNKLLKIAFNVYININKMLLSFVNRSINLKINSHIHIRFCLKILPEI